MFFSRYKMRFKKMQNYPLSIFHAAVSPESLPGADFSTFQKVIFLLFSDLFVPFRNKFPNFLIGRVVVCHHFCLFSHSLGHKGGWEGAFRTCSMKSVLFFSKNKK